MAKVCRSVCGLIRSARPALGVALDDLVEALAREPAAAVVDEQALLEPLAHDLRPAALEVGEDGTRRGRAHGHEALLGALAARAQDALLEVDVAVSRSIASEARSPQAYISSSSARSRSAGGSVPPGCSSSLATSSRESTFGSRRLCLRRAQVARSDRPG